MGAHLDRTLGLASRCRFEACEACSHRQLVSLQVSVYTHAMCLLHLTCLQQAACVLQACTTVQLGLRTESAN